MQPVAKRDKFCATLKRGGEGEGEKKEDREKEGERGRFQWLAGWLAGTGGANLVANR